MCVRCELDREADERAAACERPLPDLRFVSASTTVGPKGDLITTAVDTEGRIWRHVTTSDGLLPWIPMPAHPMSARGREEERGRQAMVNSGLDEVIREGDLAGLYVSSPVISRSGGK